MNFYQKHIPEDQKIEAIFHQHWLVVLDSFILWLSFGAFIPSFLYYQSERIRDIIPFFVMEIFLCVIFFKIVYELYNWYYDAWIITETSIYDIEWSLLKTRVESIHLDSIEGIEVDKHRIWDSIFNKGDITIQKFGDEEVSIYNVFAPYKCAEILEQFIQHEEHEEEVDRFDMIMDALSGVVREHLERNGTPEASHHTLHADEDAEDQDENEIDDFTIDMRHETHR